MQTAPLTVFLGLLILTAQPVVAVTNLLTNSGFLDVNMDLQYGDGWDNIGNTSFDAFFGAGNPHASLFGDDSFHFGLIEQTGVPGIAGQSYQFDLMNVRIEANWDADLFFGLEYYAADDATKLGETMLLTDTATRLTLPNVGGDGAANGAVFSMQGTAVPGTAFVRPVVMFDNVNSSYIGGITQQANLFVFDTFLSESPTVGDEFLKNPGFEDENGDGFVGDFWNSYGNAGFNDFFGGNGHASLLSDQPGNFGGVFQQSILGVEDAIYEFRLDDVRIEANVAADFRFGLEYFGDDDFTKLGESIAILDTSVTGDGLSFGMAGKAVTGTSYVRPFVAFDNVTSTAAGQENVFVFDASLTRRLDGIPAVDFNGDGMVDGVDIDALVLEIVNGTNNLLFDLTSDGTVDGSDLSQWLTDAGAINLLSGGPYLVGDANLDGVVDGTDFSAWNSAKFTATPAWTQGDFDASGTVDGSDFNAWNVNKFMSSDSVAAVPEPGTWCSAVVLLMAAGLRRFRLAVAERGRRRFLA